MTTLAPAANQKRTKIIDIRNVPYFGNYPVGTGRRRIIHTWVLINVTSDLEGFSPRKTAALSESQCVELNFIHWLFTLRQKQPSIPAHMMPHTQQICSNLGAKIFEAKSLAQLT